MVIEKELPWGQARCLPEKIISEIEKIAKQGIKEVVITGIHVASYGKDFKEKYESSLAGDWNYYNESFGNVTWFFEEGAFIEIVSDYPSFMKELFPFLEKFNIEKELLTELYLYQELLIRKPFEREKKAAFSYDFHSFFENATKGKPSALKKKELVLNVVPKKEYKLLSEYSKETVWFGRRRGATIYSGNEIIFD